MSVHLAVFPRSIIAGSIQKSELALAFGDKQLFVDFSQILSTIFVKDVSFSCYHVMNFNFKNVWVILKHKNSIQRFGVIPFALECEFFDFIFIKAFSIGSTWIKLASVLLVFIQKIHLTLAFRSCIRKLSLIE